METTHKTEVTETMMLAYGASPSYFSANMPVAVAAGAAADINSTAETTWSS